MHIGSSPYCQNLVGGHTVFVGSTISGTAVTW